MSEDALYSVSWSKAAIDSLKSMSRKLGRRSAELARLVRSLDGRLRRDPLNLGEIYRRRGEVFEHLAVSAFLAIDFAWTRSDGSCWFAPAGLCPGTESDAVLTLIIA